MITIQRSVGTGGDATRAHGVFSLPGVAPALANMLGPVVAGLIIDAAFRAAFGVLCLMPVSLACLRAQRAASWHIARSGGCSAQRQRRAVWRCCACRSVTPAARQLAALWRAGTCTASVLPVLGHERGMSASAIGAILGLFKAAVAAVRLVVPVLAHRLRETRCSASRCCAASGGVRGLSAGARGVPLMAVCAVLLRPLG